MGSHKAIKMKVSSGLPYIEKKRQISWLFRSGAKPLSPRKWRSPLLEPFLSMYRVFTNSCRFCSTFFFFTCKTSPGFSLKRHGENRSKPLVLAAAD